MKIRRLLIVIATVITALLLLLLLFMNRSPFGNANSSFSTDSNKDITRVEFTEGNKKLSLERIGDNWLINGKLEARKTGILFLLRVLKEIKIKSPVSEGLFSKEITGEKIIPVRVRAYDKRKLLTDFLIYKTQSNKYGNIMKRREGTKPFMVYVPGFEGDIGAAFTFNTLYWQPFTIYNLLPSEIGSVDFQNSNDPSSSFIITNRNQHFKISSAGADLINFDSSRISRYLSYFAHVPFENWVFDLKESDKKSVESGQPLYNITVTTTSGETTNLKLWERTKADGDSTSRDTDRMIGRTDKNNDYFIIRYFDIDPLLKKRSYFFAQ